MPCPNRILKCIVQIFFITKSFLQSIQVCSFSHSFLIVFTDTILSYCICNLSRSFKMMCNLRNLLWRADYFKFVLLQIDHIIGHINSADCINNVMLILQIYNPPLLQFPVNTDQHKPGCKIEHGNICHHHSTFYKYFTFRKKNINRILSTFCIFTIIYLSIFGYANKLLRLLIRIKCLDIWIFCHCFSPHSQIIRTDDSFSIRKNNNSCSFYFVPRKDIFDTELVFHIILCIYLLITNTFFLHKINDD